MRMSRAMTRIANNLYSFNSNAKTKVREKPKMVAKTVMFLLGLNAMDVKSMDT